MASHKFVVNKGLNQQITELHKQVNSYIQNSTNLEEIKKLCSILNRSSVISSMNDEDLLTLVTITSEKKNE